MGVVPLILPFCCGGEDRGGATPDTPVTPETPESFLSAMLEVRAELDYCCHQEEELNLERNRVEQEVRHSSPDQKLTVTMATDHNMTTAWFFYV